MKMNLFSNIFSKKQNNIFGNIKAKVPKTTQDTIPFIEAYENGLFLTGENTYTLIFAYNNIDYFLFRDDEKEDIIDVEEDEIEPEKTVEPMNEPVKEETSQPADTEGK